MPKKMYVYSLPDLSKVVKRGNEFYSTMVKCFTFNRPTNEVPVPLMNLKETVDDWDEYIKKNDVSEAIIEELKTKAFSFGMVEAKMEKYSDAAMEQYNCSAKRDYKFYGFRNEAKEEELGSTLGLFLGFTMDKEGKNLPGTGWKFSTVVEGKQWEQKQHYNLAEVLAAIANVGYWVDWVQGDSSVLAGRRGKQSGVGEETTEISVKKEISGDVIQSALDEVFRKK